MAWHHGEDHELPLGRTLADGTRHAFEYDPQGRVRRASSGWDDDTQRWRDDVVQQHLVDGRRLEDRHTEHGGVVHRYDASDALVESVALDTFHTAWTALSGGGARMTDPAGHVHVLLRDRVGQVLHHHDNGVRELSQYAPGGRLVARCLWHERANEAPRVLWQLSLIHI